MTWLHSLSIRTKLLVLGLIITLPAFGLIIHAGQTDRSKRLNDTTLAAERATQSLADELIQLTSNARQLSTTLALLPEIQRRDTRRLQPILHKLLRQNPIYLNILIADRQGDVWVSALHTDHTISVRDRRYFTNLLTSDRFSSGSFAIGRIIAKPVYSFAHPLHDDNGTLSGAIVLTLDLERVATHLRLHLGNAPLNVTVSDYQGTVLFRQRAAQPPANEELGQRDFPPLFNAMHDGPPQRSYIGYGQDGVKRFIAYQKLTLEEESVPHLYIRSGIPLKYAYQAADHAMLFNVALMLLLLLLALAVAWAYTTNCILLPINRLSSAVQHLAQGDLNVRIPSDGPNDELGALSSSFNLMAQQLSQRVLEQTQTAFFLNQNRTRLMEAETLAQLGSFNWDLATNEMDWSDELYRLLGFTRDSSRPGPERFLQAIHPDDRKQVRDLFTNMAEYSDYAEYQFRVIHEHGLLLYLHGRNTVIRDDKGTAIRIQGTAQDITEQVETRQRLQEYHHALLTMTDQLSRAEERERQRLASDLHDDIAQTLALCSIRLSSPHLATGNSAQSQEIALIRQRIDNAIESIRGMITRLSPPILHEMGFRSALEWLVTVMRQEWNLQVELRCDELPQLPLELQRELFRIIRELLTNSAKYAGTDLAWLTLEQDPQQLLITVQDQGQGFDTEMRSKGFGLFSIKQKLQTLQGSFTLHAGPGQGTTARISIPLPSPGIFPGAD